MELPADWAAAVASWLDLRRFERLRDAVAAERRAATVYPPEHLVFEAFRRTPFDRVRVVLVGQDPYHGPGQACGLAFAVPPGVAPPPSLVNLLGELRADLGHPPPGHGWLGAWAARGVLLLNTVLSVREHDAGSHHGLGWEVFTDAVLDALAARPEPVVFALLGGPAQKKAARLRDRPVIAVAHPSPLSFARFRGCRLFSRIDAALGAPFDWSLPATPDDGPDVAPRAEPAIAALGRRPEPELLRRLLRLDVWTRCAPSERAAVSEAVERVLPRRFSLVDLATFSVGATTHAVARFSFEDPDRGPRRFHLIPGGSGWFGRDARRAKLTPAWRARFATVARAAGWPEAVEDWLAAELPAPRTAEVGPFLLEVEAPLLAEDLPRAGRDLDALGSLQAALAVDGLRLPSPDELEWARQAGAPGPFPWGAVWPFTVDLPAVGAFGVPWPSTAETTSEPGWLRRAVDEPEPDSANGWRAAIAWCSAAFAAGAGLAGVRRARSVFPYDARSG